MKGLRTLAMAVVVVAVLGLMWYQAFSLTGVTARVATPGATRPAPPPAPELSPLPLDQADIDLFARVHPVWTAF
jgi:hypothetical protein